MIYLCFSSDIGGGTTITKKKGRKPMKKTQLKGIWGKYKL